MLDRLPPHRAPPCAGGLLDTVGPLPGRRTAIRGAAMAGLTGAVDEVLVYLKVPWRMSAFAGLQQGRVGLAQHGTAEVRLQGESAARPSQLRTQLF